MTALKYVVVQYPHVVWNVMMMMTAMNMVANINPGNIPARYSSGTEVSVMKPNRIRLIEGGIMMPSVPPAAMSLPKKIKMLVAYNDNKIEEPEKTIIQQQKEKYNLIRK